MGQCGDSNKSQAFFHELLDNSCLHTCGNDAGYEDLDTSYEL